MATAVANYGNVMLLFFAAPLLVGAADPQICTLDLFRNSFKITYTCRLVAVHFKIITQKRAEHGFREYGFETLNSVSFRGSLISGE